MSHCTICICSVCKFQENLFFIYNSCRPKCTYEEALEHFLKAEELKAGFYSMNKVMIGKCYMAMKNNAKAKEYFTQATAVNVINEDDKKCREEGTKLLAKVK